MRKKPVDRVFIFKGNFFDYIYIELLRGMFTLLEIRIRQLWDFV